MKKWMAGILALAMVLSLFGCGEAPEEPAATVALETTPVETEAQMPVLYEDENCRIWFSHLEPGEDQILAHFRADNYTQRTLTFQSDCIALNGESFCSIVMSDEVAPGSEGDISMRIRDVDPAAVRPEGIASVSGSFTIIDFDNEEFHDGNQSYRIRYEDVAVPCGEAFVWDREPGQPLYDDDQVSISYLKTARDEEYTGVWFRVANKTREVITIQAEALALNGKAADRLIGSEAVAPGAAGNIRIKCIADAESVEALSGTLRIIAFDNEDFHDGRQSYEAAFSMGQGQMSDTHAAYLEMMELTGADLTKTAAGNYRYNGLTVFEEDYMVLGGQLVVNQGAMYGCAANFLELYCENDGMLYGNGPEALYEMLLGRPKPASWAEFAPEAQALYTFIFPDATEREILKAIEGLSQVEGSFDYDARVYAFTMHDLSGAAGELGISERMLGYVMAKLSEYAPEITFGENSLEFSLSVQTFG